MATNFKSKILEELGTLKLADEFRKQPFPMKAYETAMEALENLPRPITKLEDVDGLKGVGGKIKLKIKSMMIKLKIQINSKILHPSAHVVILMIGCKTTIAMTFTLELFFAPFFSS